MTRRPSISRAWLMMSYAVSGCYDHFFANILFECLELPKDRLALSHPVTEKSAVSIFSDIAGLRKSADAEAQGSSRASVPDRFFYVDTWDLKYSEQCEFLVFRSDRLHLVQELCK